MSAAIPGCNRPSTAFDRLNINAAIGESADDKARHAATDQPEDRMEEHSSHEQAPHQSRSRLQRPETNGLAEFDPSLVVARRDNRFGYLRERQAAVGRRAEDIVSRGLRRGRIRIADGDEVRLGGRLPM